jgi:hypothetical protein
MMVGALAALATAPTARKVTKTRKTLRAQVAGREIALRLISHGIVFDTRLLAARKGFENSRPADDLSAQAAALQGMMRLPISA